jgi:hypothetical protein
MHKMSLRTRQEVVDRLRSKYQNAGRPYRRKLIDELCSVGGYERKYAIKILNGQRPGPRGRRRGGSRARYGPAETQVVAVIWKLGDYPCGKRLRAMLPLWLPAYEQRHGVLSADRRQKLHRVSASTLDRLLAPRRLKLVKRVGGTKPGRLLRTQIPVRCENWDIDRPGYLEADTVDHGGDSTAGDFMRSITYTDIYSGWTEQAAIWNKSATAVLAQTRQIERALPFPLLGFDADNGGEFLNYALWRYFQQRGRPIQFTRSRAYHKNDNAHVEQKNWTKVRLLLGYARYDQPELVEQVQQLYRQSWRLLQNFFQPVMKLRHKQRHGSRVKKIYDRPQTPAQRLLAWPGLSAQQRRQLQQLQATLDPITLSEAVNSQLQRIRRQLREGRRDAA